MSGPPGSPAEVERALGDGLTRDALLNGRVILRQARHGHRVGTDAILLAAMIPDAAEGLVVDVGAGCGAVGICIGVQAGATRLALVENEPGAAALARDNLALNGLGDRGRVVECNVLVPKERRAAGLLEECASVVVSNPPFFDAGAVRPSGRAARAQAHVMPAAAEGGDPLAAWIRACLALLAPGGTFAMIHRPEKLATILAALEGRAGSVRVIPVHPYASAPASRVLIGASKGSRGPTALAPMLVLHEPGGVFTGLSAALHRGEARL